MADPSDAALRDLQNVMNELLDHLGHLETLQDTTADSNQSSIVSSQNRDLDRLKIRIDHFFQQHPDIVNRIKNYFYDDFLMYMLRRTISPSFTPDDATQMQNRFNLFFNEYQENNEIIINYFFDHLTPFINSKFPRWKLLIQGISRLSMYLRCKIVIYCLKKYGATYLTSLMYPKQIELVQWQNRKPSNAKKYFLLLFFFIILCCVIGFEIFRFPFYYFVKFICAVFVLYVCLKFYNYH
jgi:hypothetical protein